MGKKLQRLSWHSGKYQTIFLYLFNIIIFINMLTVIIWNSDARIINEQGLYTKDISEYEISYPIKVSQNGDLLSSNVTSHHSNYNRPSHTPQHNLYLNISIANINYHFNLQPTKHHFLAPNVIIETHHSSNRRSRRSIPSRKSNCHYRGTIHNQPNSQVALSACNGLVGYIRSESDEFLVEPVHTHFQMSEKGHKHIIFRRSAVKSKPSSHKKQRKKKKKQHKSKNCGTRQPNRPTETRLEWQKLANLVKVQGKKRSHRFVHNGTLLRNRKKFHRKKKHKRRSVSLPRFVEAMVVADNTMMDYHNEGDVETYLLTIMNMVSSIFADKSIGNLIKVVVVRIMLIEYKDPELEVMHNADLTLRNFCKWQRNQNVNNDTNPIYHDVAILVTRKDICARQNTPCNTLGVAHVGGMCQSDRSCSVNEDNGISLAHTITHELGHNFGMYHDTEKIGCNRRSGLTQHVMTPSFEADTVSIAWSSCSRRDITNFFDQGLGNCLDDVPNETETYSYPDLPPGAMYNAEHQCILEFGKGAKVCSHLNEICSSLWCEVDGSCITSLKPAATGTHCGKHKWCQNKKCVPVSEREPVIDGDWGDWGDWSECSRSCGAGVSIQERRCDNPEPSSGGAYCVGERRRYRMCNTNPCPEGTPGFRATQCAQYNNHTFHGKKYEWLPYFEKSEPCELYCSDANETVIVPWGRSAKDGTPCTVGRRDICISGVCRKVGCDWVIGSDAKEDRCGICNGNGKNCDSIKGIYVKQAHGAGYKEVVVIPAGSRSIKIEELDYSKNYIGISNARSPEFYLNGNWEITVSGQYKIAGTEALYERENEFERIKIPGPIQEDILLYMISRGKTRNPGIQYEYTLAKSPNLDPKPQFEWRMADWTPCSVTCGGGIQYQYATCIDTVTKLETPPPLPCMGEDQPDDESRECNTEPCPSHWWSGPWQPCPVTCTRKGDVHHRTRSVMCVDDHDVALDDKYCDKHRKPKEREFCRSLPICSEEFAALKKRNLD